jgi:hypothetical protein
MFVLNLPFRVVASSTRKEYTPKKGSTGFISRASFPSLISSINGTNLQYPVLISSVEALITHFGFEEKERAEKRIFYAVLPLIKSYTEEKGNHFLSSCFPRFYNKNNRLQLGTVLPLLSGMFWYGTSLSQNHDLDEDTWIEIVKKPVFCVLAANIDINQFQSVVTVNAWLKNILNAMMFTKEETCNSVVQAVNEPIFKRALIRNSARKELFFKRSPEFKMLLGRKILSVYLRSRYNIYLKAINNILDLPEWAKPAFFKNTDSKSLYLNYCLRLSLINNSVFLPDRLVKGKFGPEISEEIQDAYKALTSLNVANP